MPSMAMHDAFGQLHYLAQSNQSRLKTSPQQELAEILDAIYLPRPRQNSRSRADSLKPIPRGISFSLAPGVSLGVDAVQAAN